MDVKAYKSSGILELYTMDALSAAESREVEALASQYPAIRSELTRIQDALNNYALLHSEEPRPELKQEILKKVHAKPNNIVSAGSIFSRNWISIAALLVAAVASIFAIICYSHSIGLEQQLNNVLSENEILKRTSSKAVAQLDFINNPNTQSVPLGEAATVYWDTSRQATLLAIRNLPAPPPGKQYQLWSIQGDQAPKSAGLIDYDPIRLQEMMPVSVADAFAISLEDEGGSAQPTQVIIIGKVTIS